MQGTGVISQQEHKAFSGKTGDTWLKYYNKVWSVMLLTEYNTYLNIY